MTPLKKNEGKRSQAILLTATGVPVHEICDRLGLSKSTMIRWRAEADFQTEVRETIQRMQSEAIAKLVDSQLPALRKLTEILDCPLPEETSAGVQARAAIALLTLGIQQREHERAARFEEMEKALGRVAEQTQPDIPKGRSYRLG